MSDKTNTFEPEETAASKDALFEQYGFSGGKSKQAAPDFGGFLSGQPVSIESDVEEVVEETIPDAPVETTDPSINYMANMQNMFKSLSEDTTEEPAEEIPVTEAPEPEEEVTTEFSSFMLGKEGDIPVKSQTDLLSAEADPFRDAPSAEVPSEDLEAEEKGAAAEPRPVESDKQVKEKKPVEKGEEYWSFVDSLLDNFDDTKVTSKPRVGYNVYPEEPKVTAEEAAAAVKEATAPTAAAVTTEVEAPVVAAATAATGRKKKRKKSRFSLAGGVEDSHVLPFEEPEAPSASDSFDDALLEEYSLGTGSHAHKEEPEPQPEPLTTKASTATPEEARSTGEAPPAGGYFMPRPNAPKQKPEPVPEKLVVEETLLEEIPVLEEEPVIPVVTYADEEPVAEETAETPAPEAPAEPEVPAKPDKKAEKAARAAEKQAAKEAKEAEKASRAAEKQAAKEAKAAEKAAAKEAKAAAKAEAPEKAETPAEPVVRSSTVIADDVVMEEVVLEPTEEEVNASFDNTYVEEKASGGALKVLRRIIVTLAALVILACAVVLGYSFAGDKLNSRQFSQAATLYTEDAGLKNLSAAQKKYPDVSFPKGMAPKFAGLYAQNQDLSGWVSVPDTSINYPVVQTDNDTFYLNHNFKKAYSSFGTPFLSCKNDAKELDLNNVVFGESPTEGNQMFADLSVYRTADGFKKHPLLQYSTLYDDYTFKVYAVFVTNSTKEGDNGYVFDYTVPNLATVDSFAGFVAELNQRRLYDTGVDIESSDKLLTLSTNAEDFDGARLVVVGRLLRPDESESIDAKLVKNNKSPRYPQAYYDANGLDNPYANELAWVPTVS